MGATPPVSRPRRLQPCGVIFWSEITQNDRLVYVVTGRSTAGATRASLAAHPNGKWFPKRPRWLAVPPQQQAGVARVLLGLPPVLRYTFHLAARRRMAR